MKKGYLRTIEAVIAVVLIFIFLISVMPRQKNTITTPEEIETLQDKIAGEVENNPELRNYVLTGDYTSLESFIKEKIPADRMDFNFNICDFNSNLVVCSPTNEDLGLPTNKDVYARSIMISSSTSRKIFRLFIWYKV